MNIQRNIHDLADRVHNDLVESLRISHLNDLLTKIVSELVSHHTWEDWQHLINQGLVEFAFIFAVKISLLNFGLEISAPALIEAEELKAHQYLLVFRRELLLLDLEGFDKRVLLTICKQLHWVEFLSNLGVWNLFLVLLIATTVQHVLQEVQANGLEPFGGWLLILPNTEYRTTLLRLLEIWVIKIYSHLILRAIENEGWNSTTFVDWLGSNKHLVVKSVVALELLGCHWCDNSVLFGGLLVLNNLMERPLRILHLGTLLIDGCRIGIGTKSPFFSFCEVWMLNRFLLVPFIGDLVVLNLLFKNAFRCLLGFTHIIRKFIYIFNVYVLI